MYDVIVAGAGPAGSAAAKTLADRGLRVLLAERAALPRYKSCSGMLIQKALRLTESCFGRPVPPSVACAPAENHGMILTDAHGREYAFPQMGLNVWRSSYDAWLAGLAAESGAELRPACAVLSARCREESVTVTFRDGRREEARYVVSCGGAADGLRLRLQGHAPPAVRTYQVFYEGQIRLDPHYFYAWLAPELSDYDAWFNVKDHLLVLGVSAMDHRRLPDFHRRFLAELRDRHGLELGRARREDSWLMPRVRPGCPLDLGAGRVLFAGESAGFLNPMGEGVSGAIESGRAAALALSAHLEDPPAALEAYRAGTEALHAYMKRQWRLTAALSERFREMNV